MNIPFSELPGRHERHYRRRLQNPLFPRPIAERDDEALLEMQRLDHEELLELLDDLRGVVQRAVDLKPNEDTEIVLKLKADLDALYARACACADDQSGNKMAIRELNAVIWKNIWQAAAGDAKAEQELEEESVARTQHFIVLEYPLAADLLHDESTIEPDELVPTLLNADSDNLASALSLFDADQLTSIAEQAEVLLEKTPLDEARQTQAASNLTNIQQQLRTKIAQPTLN